MKWLDFRGRARRIDHKIDEPQPLTTADNLQPSAREWAAACDLGRAIVNAVENRDTIIEREGLDRSFGIAASNWASDAPNDYLDAYRLVSTLDWNEVRHLRFRSQMFSGYSLLHMRRAEGSRSTEAVPNDLPLPAPPAETIRAWRRLTEGLPPSRIFSPPWALGERGWLIDGVIVNDDTRVYQERMTLLHASGVLDRLERLGRPPRIIEIGAGYGAIAYALTSCFPSCHYTICDLPESLLFSGLYLSLAGKRHVYLTGKPSAALVRGIELLPNYWFEKLAASGRRYDLAINVLSMSEMAEGQIVRYATGLKMLLEPYGVFFEQNQDNRPHGMAYAAVTIGEVFEHRNEADCGIGVSQGRPFIWSTKPLPSMLRSA
jgi:hypothetical protein